MMNELIPYLSLSLLIIIFVSMLTLLVGWRYFMKLIVRKVGGILLTDSYQENLIELLPGMRHMGIQNVLENNLRAETGTVLHRPLGSSKNWPHLDSITFLPAQTGPFPTSKEVPIDVAVTIGPKAKKPLSVEKPFLISGMAYGVALSEEVRLALTNAANATGIAINSGEGGILPEELETAEKFILQFSKTEWGKEEETIKQADMIEIKLGQGSMMGLGAKVAPGNLTGRARDVMGLKEGEDAVIHEHFFEDQKLEDFKELITDLREFTGGVPIGVKLGAGGKIEQDIDHILEMGVDYIAIDGGQAATLGSPPLVADDVGIPTLHAVVRASNHLKKRKVNDQVSLIISGGLMTPGHYLKVLALGADAVYLGSVLLFTVAHKQIFDALPFEPPTQVVWNEGKFSNSFDMETGADAATKLLNASIDEIKEGLRAMGKTSLKELSRQDLVSYDENTANQIGIPFTFNPWKESNQANNQANDQTSNQAPDKQHGKSEEQQKQAENDAEEQNKKPSIRGRKVVSEQSKGTDKK